MLRLIALAFLLSVSPGCASSQTAAPAPLSDAELATVSIRLERTICFGTCPSYTVEIRGDGSVLYEGSKYVLIEGTHRHRIEPAAVRTLAEQFRSANFWSLQNSYQAEITDNPTQTLTVSIGGRQKTVVDYAGSYAGMPEIVATLEKAVDTVAGTDRWVTGSDQTIAALQGEGWNFRSAPAAATLARAVLEAPDSVVFGLIEGGANPDGAGGPNPSTEDFAAYATTPLEGAAMMARIDVMRRLIAAGASTKGPWIQAALRGAVVSGDPPTVAEILKYHPDLNAPLAEGYNALQWIKQGPHPRYDAPDLDEAGVIKLLRAAGARD